MWLFERNQLCQCLFNHCSGYMKASEWWLSLWLWALANSVSINSALHAQHEHLLFIIGAILLLCWVFSKQWSCTTWVTWVTTIVLMTLHPSIFFCLSNSRLLRLLHYTKLIILLYVNSKWMQFTYIYSSFGYSITFSYSLCKLITKGKKYFERKLHWFSSLFH